MLTGFSEIFIILIVIIVLGLILATVSDSVASILVFIIFGLIVFGIIKLFKNKWNFFLNSGPIETGVNSVSWALTPKEKVLLLMNFVIEQRVLLCKFRKPRWKRQATSDFQLLCKILGLKATNVSRTNGPRKSKWFAFDLCDRRLGTRTNHLFKFRQGLVWKWS